MGLAGLANPRLTASHPLYPLAWLFELLTLNGVIIYINP